MTHKGQAFELAFKHRQLDSGPEVYWACDALQQTISRLYRQAGIAWVHLTAADARSRRRCLLQPAMSRQCKRSLGMRALTIARPYLTVDQATIRRAYEGLGEREFDACFEMGDSEEVIAELVRTARKEGFIDNIKSWCGNESFARWSSYADRQGELF